MNGNVGVSEDWEVDRGIRIEFEIRISSEEVICEVALRIEVLESVARNALREEIEERLGTVELGPAVAVCNHDLGCKVL